MLDSFLVQVEQACDVPESDIFTHHFFLDPDHLQDFVDVDFLERCRRDIFSPDPLLLEGSGR